MRRKVADADTAEEKTAWRIHLRSLFLERGERTYEPSILCSSHLPTIVQQGGMTRAGTRQPVRLMRKTRMITNASPIASDHAGHRIRSRAPQIEELVRTIKGNAWCYDCYVPVEGFWSVTFGLKADLTCKGDHTLGNE
jgi:hypothetical protein